MGKLSKNSLGLKLGLVFVRISIGFTVSIRVRFTVRVSVSAIFGNTKVPARHVTSRHIANVAMRQLATMTNNFMPILSVSVCFQQP